MVVPSLQSRYLQVLKSTLTVFLSPCQPPFLYVHQFCVIPAFFMKIPLFGFGPQNGVASPPVFFFSNRFVRLSYQLHPAMVGVPLASGTLFQGPFFAEPFSGYVPYFTPTALVLELELPVHVTLPPPTLAQIISSLRSLHWVERCLTSPKHVQPYAVSLEALQTQARHPFCGACQLCFRPVFDSDLKLFSPFFSPKSRFRIHPVQNPLGVLSLPEGDFSPGFLRCPTPPPLFGHCVPMGPILPLSV